MTSFKYFIKIAFSYRLSILPYVAVFLLISILTSSAVAGGHKQVYEVPRSNVLLLTDDSAPQASTTTDIRSLLTAYLEKHHNTTVKPASRFSEDQLKVMVARNGYDIILRFEPHPNKALAEDRPVVKLISDQGNENIISGVADLRKFLAFAKAIQKTEPNGGYTYDTAALDRALGQQTKVQIVDTALLDKSGVKAASKAADPAAASYANADDAASTSADQWSMDYFRFAGFIILAVIMNVLPMIRREYALPQVQHRMNISATQMYKLDLQEVLAESCIAFGITVLLFGVHFIIRPSGLSMGQAVSYAVQMLVFTIVAICIAHLISSISNNPMVISALANAIPLGLSFVSGIMVQQQLLSPGVLKFASAFPVFYYARAVTSYTSNIITILPDLLIQLGFAAFYLILGLVISRVKEQKRRTLQMNKQEAFQ